MGGWVTMDAQLNDEVVLMSQSTHCLATQEPFSEEFRDKGNNMFYLTYLIGKNHWRFLMLGSIDTQTDVNSSKESELIHDLPKLLEKMERSVRVKSKESLTTPKKKLSSSSLDSMLGKEQETVATQASPKKLSKVFFASERISKSISGNKKIKNERTFRDRKDVVNKSILRAIRKFFCIEFRQEFPQPRFRNMQKSITYYEESLDEYLRKYESFIPDILTSDGVDSRNTIVKVIIGNTINHQLMQKVKVVKRQKYSSELMQFIEDYDRCCKQYSHAAYCAVRTSPYFKILFELFYSNLRKSKFKQIKVFKGNPDTYLSALKDLDSILKQ